MEDRPKIRAGIEAVPAVRGGREVLVLHDRTHISPEWVVDRASASLLTLMDGAHDLRDIQVTLMRRGGLGLVSLEAIRGFVRQLDDQLLLDSPRYRDHCQAQTRAYRAERLRPAAHAGRAYPEDPTALGEQLDGFFAASKARGARTPTRPFGNLTGLVLPHIDFQRGGTCYAWGYDALRDAMDEVDLFVILGTCHLPMALPMALTTKTFETPLGKAESAVDLAETVARQAGMDLFQDELAHRAEHTIEFHVVFLQHLARRTDQFQILPVLCGGFHEMMAKRLLPSSHLPYTRALEALGEVLANASRRICILASADLAHLGPQFGDPRPVNLSDLARIQREDMAMLDPVCKGDADGFFRHILAEGDRRRICGLPPIYTWLRLLTPGKGQLLNYDQAFNPQFTVTFASIAMWGASASGA
jgi:AmmeMemoRadiSam system protein B